MKLAKQIITLSAAALLALGLSFVLISAITIGTQSSTGPEAGVREIWYNESVTEINEKHDKYINEVKAVVVGAAAINLKPAKTDTAGNAPDIKTSTNEGAAESTSFATETDKNNGIAKAEKAKEDALRKAKNAHKENLLSIDKSYATKLTSAFTYAKTTVTYDASTGNYENYSVSALTPMGCIMVTGLALTLAGGALVATVIIMNKLGDSDKKSKKPAA
jgi:hypothetical protein